MNKLLILRPEPGATATAKRARALGLEPVVAPIFTIGPIAWDAPDPSEFEAVMITSANASRHGGWQLGQFTHLPCYAVGEASAAAAREAGFDKVRTGPSDGAALLDMMADEGITRAFHASGREHVGLAHPAVEIERRAVYAVDPLPELPEEAQAALSEGALVLLHSPRTAAHFRELAGERRSSIQALAISKAAAIAAGPGWGHLAVAVRPRDEAMLELAAQLCKTGGAGLGLGD